MVFGIFTSSVQSTEDTLLYRHWADGCDHTKSLLLLDLIWVLHPTLALPEPQQVLDLTSDMLNLSFHFLPLFFFLTYSVHT